MNKHEERTVLGTMAVGILASAGAVIYGFTVIAIEFPVAGLFLFTILASIYPLGTLVRWWINR